MLKKGMVLPNFVCNISLDGQWIKGTNFSQNIQNFAQTIQKYQTCPIDKLKKKSNKMPACLTKISLQ